MNVSFWGKHRVLKKSMSWTVVAHINLYMQKLFPFHPWVSSKARSSLRKKDHIMTCPLVFIEIILCNKQQAQNFCPYWSLYVFPLFFVPSLRRRDDSPRVFPCTPAEHESLLHHGHSLTLWSKSITIFHHECRWHCTPILIVILDKMFFKTYVVTI